MHSSLLKLLLEVQTETKHIGNEDRKKVEAKTRGFGICGITRLSSGQSVPYLPDLTVTVTSETHPTGLRLCRNDEIGVRVRTKHTKFTITKEQIFLVPLPCLSSRLSMTGKYFKGLSKI